MKLLWVKTDFLHPATKGGQIRTLGMLRCLHRRYEVHYLGCRIPGETEGLERSSEYCSKAYPVDFEPVEKTSWKFGLQLAAGLASPLPLAISRYRCAGMTRALRELLATTKFDRVVCDFLFPAVNFPSMEGVVLFQHNVETMIWQRRVEHATNPLQRAYLQRQADRMFEFERHMCRAAAKVIGVSPVDAALMEEMFGLTNVGHVATGVDLDYFARPNDVAPERDLIFIGSMDWAPNIDGIQYFVTEVLPLIRQRRPGTKLSIVGRDPSPELRALAQKDPLIEVTGTVADVRPYLWSSQVSIVPLRIGGGTRLKIYEAMAAGVATVSSRIGAEGLAAKHPNEIRLADTAPEFAAHCLELLDQPKVRSAMSAAAWNLVHDNYSWESVTDHWEEQLRSL